MKRWEKSKKRYTGFVEFESNKESLFIKADQILSVTQKNLTEVKIEMSSGVSHSVAGAIEDVVELIAKANT